ncbi:hypothetical protein pb186bvf_006218 [Paramecium bursaria]
MKFLILFIIGCSLAIPEADQVDNAQLNEYAGINYQGLFFSGYLDVTSDGATKFHYYFYVSEAGGPADETVPVLLWLNGGPGCSSLQGALMENGPFVFDKGELKVHLNEYSWTEYAHVLYLESPAKVGFSYGDITGISDEMTAKQNLQALISFFKKFPEIVDRDFYISGESYAGIYIPTLVDQIIDYNNDPQKTTPNIKIKGVAIGNGCTDPTECTDASEAYPQHEISFFGRHNFIEDSLFQEYRGYNEAGTCADLSNLPKQCTDLADKIESQYKGLWFNPYNIYDRCWHSLTKTKYPRTKFARKVGEDEFVECTDSSGLYKFLTDDAWLTLTHIDKTKSAAWQECSDDVFPVFKKDPRGSYYLYPKLIKNDIKILKFSGDIDAVVPITGTLYWINKLQQEYNIQTIQEWKAWTVPGDRDVDDPQLAGEYWILDGLTFATVRGAGHMVPTDKRREASQMIKNFFEGFPLKQ